MLVLGAKGFAKQLFEALSDSQRQQLCFFDDVTPNPEPVFGKFPVLTTEKEALDHFARFVPDFALGIGNPELRRKMAERFINLGGNLTTVVSRHAIVSQQDCVIGQGATIMAGAIIEGSTRIGAGVLINLYATITHDCEVGAYSEICPGARISGGCKIGDLCMVGTGAVLLPKVAIGNCVKVGAGAVVTTSFSEPVTLTGVPAKPARA